MNWRALIGSLNEFLPDKLDLLGWDGGFLVLFGAVALALLAALFRAIVDQLTKRLTRLLEKDHLFVLSLVFVVPAAFAAVAQRWWTVLLVTGIALALFLLHRWRPITRIRSGVVVGLVIAMLAAFWTEGRSQRRRLEKTRESKTVFAVLTFRAPGEGADTHADLVATTKDFHRLLRDSFIALPQIEFLPAEADRDDVLRRWQSKEVLDQLGDEAHSVDIVLDTSARLQQTAGEARRTRLVTLARLPSESTKGRPRAYQDVLTVFAEGPEEELVFLLNDLLWRLAEQLRSSEAFKLEAAEEDELARRILALFREMLVLNGLENTDLAQTARALDEIDSLTLDRLGELMNSYRERFPEKNEEPTEDQAAQLGKLGRQLGIEE